MKSRSVAVLGQVKDGLAHSFDTANKRCRSSFVTKRIIRGDPLGIVLVGRRELALP
jgi:hypothetical protein